MKHEGGMHSLEQTCPEPRETNSPVSKVCDGQNSQETVAKGMNQVGRAGTKGWLEAGPDSG